LVKLFKAEIGSDWVRLVLLLLTVTLERERLFTTRFVHSLIHEKIAELEAPRSVQRFGFKEGEEVLMVPENEGILLKHRMDSMRSLRGLLREEVDLKKASTFIGKVRREWRVERE